MQLNNYNLTIILSKKQKRSDQPIAKNNVLTYIILLIFI